MAAGNRDTASGTALVIDDDAILSSLIAAVCRDVGLEAHVVGSVDEAAAALSDRTFDLVCCDAFLPDGTAVQVFDCLPHQTPPPYIILCTGARDPLADPRIDRVLRKPFRVQELRNTLTDRR
ncbi:MAG: response regulator [Myxococcota bacterium]